jgi:hypothetical protein
MNEGDKICFSTVQGGMVQGRFVRELDSKTIVVKVDEREFRVAKTACWNTR